MQLAASREEWRWLSSWWLTKYCCKELRCNSAYTRHNWKASPIYTALSTRFVGILSCDHPLSLTHTRWLRWDFCASRGVSLLSAQPELPLCEPAMRIIVWTGAWFMQSQGRRTSTRQSNVPLFQHAVNSTWGSAGESQHFGTMGQGMASCCDMREINNIGRPDIEMVAAQ